MIRQMDFTLNAEKIEVRSARGDTDHAIGTGFENLSIGGLLIELAGGVLMVSGADNLLVEPADKAIGFVLRKDDCE